MSVSGLCELCQQPEVEQRCDRCGQLVCDRHFEEASGVCTECVADVGRPGSPSQPDRGTDDRPDGVDTYRY